MYTATTRAIRVTVRPQYLPDQSDPARSQYVWGYQVRIENTGDVEAICYLVVNYERD